MSGLGFRTTHFGPKVSTQTQPRPSNWGPKKPGLGPFRPGLYRIGGLSSRRTRVLVGSNVNIRSESASLSNAFFEAWDDSNIMADENSFNMTGIIDWEGACTVPRELIAFPDFLTAMPASFDLPEKYGHDGQPLDK
ncbi:hypothetical protein PENCOP_c005G04810 [Penicillium coprophilum]|uniref:Aminoglycoside phosphotransferase domain-containing protein n=1 Tax=Penicillium coprophilum TaxID=36646 RepID=A0A1V6USM4_9EURO|nr:hypothetical protein PENCOP_c005G04810 [Penicillium coprophilum]